jgi:hypothetical protein
MVAFIHYIGGYCDSPIGLRPIKKDWQVLPGDLMKFQVEASFRSKAKEKK